MNEFCAAMGICNLRHAGDEIMKRKVVFEAYLDCLDGMKGIRIPIDQKGVKRNYGYFPIFIDPLAFGATRDDVFTELGRAGIKARKYFWPAINDMKCYLELGEETTPVAHAASAEVLSLPMYADLDIETVKRICEIVYSCSNAA